MEISIRVFFTILALTVCTGGLAWAQAIDFSKPYARMNSYVLGAGVAAGCTEASSLVGTVADTNADSRTLTPAMGMCFKVTASLSGCSSGTASKGYVSHYDTSAQAVKVCVYNAGAETSLPANGTTKVGCSGSIQSASAGTLSSNMDGGTIIHGNAYWLCIATDDTAGNNFVIRAAVATVDYYYFSSYTTFYDSPPSDLSSGQGIDFALNAAAAIREYWVTVK